jgi:hypothetical protein
MVSSVWLGIPSSLLSASSILQERLKMRALQMKLKKKNKPLEWMKERDVGDFKTLQFDTWTSGFA